MFHCCTVHLLLQPPAYCIYSSAVLRSDLIKNSSGLRVETLSKPLGVGSVYPAPFSQQSGEEAVNRVIGILNDSPHLMVITVNGLHSYSAFIQSALQFASHSHIHTHTLKNQ